VIGPTKLAKVVEHVDGTIAMGNEAGSRHWDAAYRATT
jgi:hypothetical protein